VSPDPSDSEIVNLRAVRKGQSILAPHQRLTISFIITLLIGIGAEYFGSMNVAIVVMFIYFGFGITLPTNVRNTEKFADSLYYLGFILTLFALFMAMTPWFNDVSQLTSRSIIVKFGIAIATTFIGMSLRIILIQLRPTTTDEEEEARESIAEYVLALNKEMGTAISDIAQFRQHVVDISNNSIEELRSHLRNISGALGGIVEESYTGFSNMIGKVTPEVESAMRSAGDLIATRMRAFAESLAIDLSGVRAVILASLGEHVASIGRLTEELKSMETAIKAANQRITQAASLPEDAGAAVQRFTDTMGQATASIEQVQRHAFDLHQRLSELSQLLQQVSGLYKSDIDEFQKNLRSAVSDIQANGEAFSASLIKNANALREAIREVEAS
jgi:methyl-accepting chemotaxis protein